MYKRRKARIKQLVFECGGVLIQLNILYLGRLILLLLTVVLPSTSALASADACDLNEDGNIAGVKENLCVKERDNLQKQMKIIQIEKALAEAEKRLQQLNKEINKTEQKGAAKPKSLE